MLIGFNILSKIGIEYKITQKMTDQERSNFAHFD